MFDKTALGLSPITHHILKYGCTIGKGGGTRVILQVLKIDAKAYLKRFLAYRELVTGKPICPDEYLFPYMSSNGAVHFDRPMTQGMVQQNINMFTSATGLMTYYTTHCFRRGGAQYRFIHAPVRWSLNAVRWWGGWTEGESVNTLSKYLLNCVQTYEKNYSSQLLVDAPHTKAATVEDIRALGYTLTDALRSAVPNAALVPSSHSFSTFSSAPYFFSSMLPVYGGYYSVYHSTTSTSSSNTDWESSVSSLPSGSSSDTSITHDLSPLPLRNSHDVSSDSLDTESSFEHPNSTLVRIPDLPHHHHRVWFEAIKQWEMPDPQLGIALCDWPTSWYTGKMKNKTAMKRRSWK
ncbi:hypothetical protein C0995_005271, partial [Termitomyces sp. Mi166